MTKAVWSGVLTAAAMVVLSAAPAFAQDTDTQLINVTVNVSARAKLTLGSGTLTFADTDPDGAGAVITAAAISLDVKSRTSSGSNVTLTVQADDDLTSGTDTIAISNLTWAVTGAGFQPGTSSTAAQTLGSWTGSGNRSGTHTYSLANSWNYNVGTYTAVLTYTLTAP
jgi:hypothetical protein